MQVPLIINRLIKRKLNRRLICECLCDERLKAKAEGSTRLAYTGWCGELEHLKTSLTPAPSHLLRFYFVGCAKEVSKLINRPVVSFFGTRVSGTGANMIAESINNKLFATTSQERMLRQCRYCCTDTRGKECLPEASRPCLNSAVWPDLPQPTRGLIPKDPHRGILFF